MSYEYDIARNAAQVAADEMASEAREARIDQTVAGMWQTLQDRDAAHAFVMANVADPSDFCAQILSVVAMNRYLPQSCFLAAINTIEHQLRIVAIDLETRGAK